MKKQQILQTAKELFSKFGIRRVTVEEVCAQANVSKGTFYKHFSNKDELVMELLNTMVSEAMTRYREIMTGSQPFREKVRQMIRLKMEHTEDLSRDFIKDIMGSGPPEAVKFYHEKASESMKAISEDFAAAQRRGEIRQTVKYEFILYFFNHMIEMMQDPRLESLYATPGEMISELTSFFFYGIMPEEGYSGKNDPAEAEKEKNRAG